MPGYEKMYHKLFNRITDALTELEQGNGSAAREILKKAQLETEDMYIEDAAE